MRGTGGEARRVLRPGGIAIIATCLTNRIHYGPKDCRRFTPDGLRLLADDFSEVITCDGRGNRAALMMVMLGFRKMLVPHSRWHPVHWIATAHSKQWMLSPWVIARK